MNLKNDRVQKQLHQRMEFRFFFQLINIKKILFDLNTALDPDIKRIEVFNRNLFE